jgi:hypothetical protein
VSGNYLCVRAGKTTESLRIHGWEHDAICGSNITHFNDSYRRIHQYQNITDEDVIAALRDGGYRLAHINNEPNWPILPAKEAGIPVILNVHDVTSARPKFLFDPHEYPAYEAADGFVFVTDAQRDFCISLGFPVEGKPYAVIGNLASSTCFVDKPLLPHIGGMVYEGGVDVRGYDAAWRDLSPLADALAGRLHIYSGGHACDYGIPHPTEFEQRALMERLAQHDWGFCGTPVENAAWSHSWPNKACDYLSAGIPIVCMNVPVLKPLCDRGLGVYVNSVQEAAAVSRTNPKPYRKRVMAQRGEFTFQREVHKVAALYEEVLACGA